MPEDEKNPNLEDVVEFIDTTNKDLIPADGSTSGETVHFDSAAAEKIEEAVGAVELKPFEWMGVKFPPYFQGPHFVEVKGSIVMAIDPACVSLEMKANWDMKYRGELSDLGKKVIEKALNIKIETL